jgi:sortase (surface protein transpeptidase)
LPTDSSVLRHEDRAWLTLITCKGYNEDTNNYRLRVAVKAVLIGVEGE